MFCAAMKKKEQQSDLGFVGRTRRHIAHKLPKIGTGLGPGIPCLAKTSKLLVARLRIRKCEDV